MQINVEIENSEEEWSYDSDVSPRKGECLTERMSVCHEVLQMRKTITA